MTRTWPEDWDARKQGLGCWFCENRPYFGTPFYVGNVGDGHLERNAVAPGHAIVIFRDRHVADFTSLTTDEAAAYWRDVHTVAGMIERVFAPCHMNYLLLGNSGHTCTSTLCPGTSTTLLPVNPCLGSRNQSPNPNSIGRSIC